jgi:hypothetical protein
LELLDFSAINEICPLLCPLFAWFSANDCERHEPPGFDGDPLSAAWAIYSGPKTGGSFISVKRLIL